jgi:putative aldouronate transport system substrate-binding protein
VPGRVYTILIEEYNLRKEEEWSMDNKRMRPIPALALCLFISGVLPGCSPQPRSPEKPGSSGRPASGVKIEVMVSSQNNLPSDSEQDVIKRELDKALGIDLKITTHVGDEDYKNQWKLRIAGNSPADLFYVDRRDMIKLSQQGSLLDLTPYMDKLKPTVGFVGEEAMATGTVKGRVFGIPKTSTAPQFTLWLRKDWLDRVGMKPPATLQEMMLVMKAFTEKDPDGNGKNDTYGFTGNPSFNALDQIFGAFGTTYPGKFYIKNGKLINSVYDPQIKDALAYTNEMVKAGVVDPDFLANTKGQQKDKAYQGQVGLLNFNWPVVVNNDAAKQIADLNPSAKWIQAAAPEGPGGAYNGYDDFGARSILVLPVTLQNEPVKLEKITKLLNYLSSTEGSRLVQYGLKDVHYTLDGSEIRPTGRIDDVIYSHMYQLLGRDEMTYLRTKFPAAEPQFSFAIAQPRIKVYDAFIQLPEGFRVVEANRYIQEEIFKFIYGKRPLAEYDDFVKTLESRYNYRSYMESAKGQLKEQGLLQ